ncbi:MAG TPA: ATP-binding protein [Vicinamibacterales bacterium]
MLTARDEVESRIAGLDCGADDYVGKPSDGQVSIETSRGQVLTVRVTDEGPGIPECDRDRIFERFHASRSQSKRRRSRPANRTVDRRGPWRTSGTRRQQ